MPRYDYECPDCGESVEIEHPMSENKRYLCPECDCHLERVIRPPAIQFIGEGWAKDCYHKKEKKS